MISDVPPGMGMPSFQKGNNMSVTVLFDEIEEAQTVFNKLSEGGKVSMELQETFWSPLYGSLTDRFGIEWQVSVEGEME
ncbi:protein PhnB [Planococcus antarcticus DSM 14505]|uniref:Protein PhnB n=1 Tax=Planococcus antarcticus DSM 14505 TaxID=1185653 RepID=A0AA87ILJ5_9BACL|nr:VOC family protein [Planococcus antarcticus]EIM06946.1 protein PhnB [Planococcus antarcticus DSM 14505]